MSVINFKEIPQANKADGKQDSLLCSSFPFS